MSAQIQEQSRKRIAPTQTQGPAKRPAHRQRLEDIVEISSDEDDGNDADIVRFQYGPRPYIQMRRSDILSFVQDRAVKIYQRQMAATVFVSQEERLKKDTDMFPDINKANFLTYYKDTARPHLKECVKEFQVELRTLNNTKSKGLTRPAQEDIFTHRFIEPVEADLGRAEEDVKMMAALVKLLQDN